MQQRKRLNKYVAIGVVIALVLTWKMKSREEEPPTRDYSEIAQEGILRITTRYGAGTYYINQLDSTDGFHYLKAKEFAQAQGWKLEVIPEMDMKRQKELLASGKVDLIADNLLLNSNPDTTIRYTTPLHIDHPIIIQRKETEDTLCQYLKSQVDLRGKTVCIPAGSPFRQRIIHLMEEIGDTIYIEEMERYGTEQLMAMVAYGDRCYAACEEEIVKAHIDSFPNLDTRLALGFNQFYAWGVSPDATTLLDSLNQWITRQKATNKR